MSSSKESAATTAAVKAGLASLPTTSAAAEGSALGVKTVTFTFPSARSILTWLAGRFNATAIAVLVAASSRLSDAMVSSNSVTSAKRIRMKG